LLARRCRQSCRSYEPDWEFLPIPGVVHSATYTTAQVAGASGGTFGRRMLCHRFPGGKVARLPDLFHRLQLWNTQGHVRVQSCRLTQPRTLRAADLRGLIDRPTYCFDFRSERSCEKLRSHPGSLVCESEILPSTRDMLVCSIP
jgi:hypothetical protein